MNLPEITRRGFVALWVPAAVVAAEDRDTPPREAILTGADAAPAASIALRAGPVTCLFDPDIAFLRYIRYGDTELLRGLYAAVRDQGWGTVTPRVHNIVSESRADSFRLTFDVECVQDDIDFPWQGVITGSADGTVRFEFQGRARSTFLKNRLGFAVLHPIAECAGKPCVVEKTSGLKEEGRFPSEVAPHQPFLEMRAITHEASPGVNVEVRFEGDTFEMEDHRNWTDYNYKTYCTPLERPFPVEVQRGQEIRQAVTVRLKGAPAPAIVKARPEVEIAVAGHVMTSLPAIGLGVATGEDPLSRDQAKMLAAAGFRHLRADVRLFDPGWRKDWDRARADALAMGVPLEAALHVSNDAAAELGQFAAGASADVSRWIVFHRDEASTSARWVQLARRHLRGGAVGAGTNLFFTELNRGRPEMASLDFACYSLNPQVHAFDDLSLVENLEGQAATVKTARTFVGGKPIAVTPVTLRPRVAGKASPDRRQRSLFGAAWTLGSVKYLSEGGVGSVTYYQTHGPEGLMNNGEAYPLYHVLADVAGFGGSRVYRVDSSDPLRACAMAVESRGQKRMLIANLTPHSRVVTVDSSWLGGRAMRAAMHEHNYMDAARQPEKFRTARGAAMEAAGDRYRLAMLPYSVARLDAVRMGR
ncbi:MAG: hypothetical protein R2762_21065 [Bryobacteraceae bacterium]